MQLAVVKSQSITNLFTRELYSTRGYDLIDA